MLRKIIESRNVESIVKTRETRLKVSGYLAGMSEEARLLSSEYVPEQTQEEIDQCVFIANTSFGLFLTIISLWAFDTGKIGFISVFLLSLLLAQLCMGRSKTFAIVWLFVFFVGYFNTKGQIRIRRESFSSWIF